MTSQKRNFKSNFCETVSGELEKANVCTPEAVLQSSEYGLLRLGSLTLNDVAAVTDKAATSILKSGFQTALYAEQQFSAYRIRLSTGCPYLDKCLGGGFSVRGINEIAGESGSGKTQLCLQLALSVQYPLAVNGLNAGAVFICTEDVFPSSRLQQLLKTYPKFRSRNYPMKNLETPNFGDNIFIEHIAEPEGLRQCVLGRLPKLLSQKKIGLIVLDSIAGVFRSSYETTEMHIRARDLRTVGGQLHLLAKQHDICVICVNQVTASIDSTSGSSSRQTVPALGLAWANLVTTRIQLHRTEVGADGMRRRCLEVVFAPDLPPNKMTYLVNDAGVCGISS